MVWEHGSSGNNLLITTRVSSSHTVQSMKNCLKLELPNGDDYVCDALLISPNIYNNNE